MTWNWRPSYNQKPRAATWLPRRLTLKGEIRLQSRPWGAPARADLLSFSPIVRPLDQKQKTSAPPSGTETSTRGRNIDQSEIDSFAALADEWWNPEGPFKPLHELGPARLSFIRETLIRQFGGDTNALRPFGGLNILDVGCGGGLTCEPLSRMGAKVTGIDPGTDTIGAASAHAASQGLDIDYRTTTIEDLAGTGAQFDAVTCLEVLEHVPDPRAFVQSCGSVVRPGGVLIASTLNRTLKSYAFAIVAAEYVLRWLPQGTHDWNSFLTTDEMAEAIRAAGCEDIRFEGIVLDPLRGGWRRSSDTDVNYMVSAVKPPASA